MPTLRRFVRSPLTRKTATCMLGLCALLFTLDGCFFFRAKTDPKAQEMASRLTTGLTPEEVSGLIGPPERRGQNLFDKRKEYWIYEFAKQQKKKRSRASDASGDNQEMVVQSELHLLFERGKLVNWNVVPVK